MLLNVISSNHKMFTIIENEDFRIRDTIAQVTENLKADEISRQSKHSWEKASGVKLLKG